MARICVARRLGIGIALGWMVACGCQGPTDTVARPPHQGVRLTIAVPDQAMIDLVRPLVDQWAQSSGAEFEMTIDSPPPRSAEQPPPPVADGARGDLRIFPGDQIGNLIDAGLLAGFASSTAPGTRDRAETRTARQDGASTDEGTRLSANLQELPQPVREKVVRYGEQRMALPIGGSAFMLVYRRDLFENSELQSAAASAGVELKPPATWESLDRLALWFAGRDRDGDGQPDPGLALAYAPGGDAELIFLSRVASLALTPDHAAFLFDLETMEPLVETPPWIEAAQADQALAAALPGHGAKLDADTARQAFREGRVPLLIDRAERAAAWTNVRSPLAIGVARLPGSSRFFDPDRAAWNTVAQPNMPPVLPSGGGWMVGLSPASPAPARAAASDLARFLASEESARALAANASIPMLPPHTRLIAEGLPDPRAMLGVDSPAWGRAVEETLSDPRCGPSLRIPDAAGYLADLAAARAQIHSGSDAATALKQLRSAWNDRTNRLGRERQIWHHRRSLNRVTDSETPPPRTYPIPPTP